MSKKSKVIKAVQEIKNTRLMQGFYNKRFLEKIKKELPNMTKEEKLKVLFQGD